MSDVSKRRVSVAWRRPNPGGLGPVKEAQDAVSARIGTNIYGRVGEFVRMAELGHGDLARRELLDLLKFFPKKG